MLRKCGFTAAVPGASPTSLGPFQRVSGSTLSKHCALAPRQAQEEEQKLAPPAVDFPQNSGPTSRGGGAFAKC